MKKLIFVLLLAITTLALGQQDSLIRKNAIKVYLDGALLDEQFIKDHLTYVNYVRDHQDADVYILIVRENAGNGGLRYTLIFEGQKKFKGQDDTLRFNTKPDETTDETRRTLLKYLKAGLLPYVVNSPLFDYINIGYKPPKKQTNKIVEDKWHSWVFNLGIHGFANGESRYQDLSISGTAEASKVTPKWIIDLTTDYSLNKSKYVINKNYTVISLTRSTTFNGLIVKSLNDHWSAGLMSELGQSTYKNYKFYFNFTPAIEYDIFPYSQSTVHQLRILYCIGFKQNFYNDTTIYNKIQQLIFHHRLSITYIIRKKWGSINFALVGQTFIPDFSKNSFGTTIGLSIRLFKGFSVDMTSSYGFVHDQVSLPKGNATLEEILTQQQQLATSFRYWAFFGISYTFGSIYNNVVNPRFGHSDSNDIMY